MLKKSTHILLVEDSEFHRAMIRKALSGWQGDIRVSHVESLAEARRALEKDAFDLVLLDYKLPDGVGTELLRDRGELICPFVMLTGSGDEKAAVETLRAGALDYLIKSPETLADLPKVIERSLREGENVRRRLEAEEALRRSEEKYRNLFNHMSEAVAIDEAVRDAEGRMVDWRVLDANPAYEEIYGIARSEAVGRRAGELYPGKFDFGPILGLAAEALDSGRSTQTEIHFQGEGKYVLISIFPLGEDRFATLGRDITERARLLAELDATINAIADAVIIYGPDGEIRHMNPAARQKFGYSDDDRNRPLADRLAGLRVETTDGRPFPLLEIMQRVVAGERMEGILAVMHRQDGKELWLSNSAAPIVTAEGERMGAVGTSTDITELHRLQEERDQYLHTISHDLRIPLTVIRGYVQLIEESLTAEKREDQVPQMLTELSGGVRKMSRMIDDLVEMARLEGGKITRESVPIRLDLLVEGMRQRIMEGFDWNDLVLEIPEDLPAVQADPDHLERILMNLLTNARKYSPPDSPVRLDARREDSAAVVSVTDRGEGIALQDQPHIFERFYRTEKASRRDSVGLGLYITCKLVEANGGRIWLESEPGKGSTFSFSLPFA